MLVYFSPGSGHKCAMSEEAMAEKFASWLRSHGGSIHPDLDFFHGLRGNDRGVLARKAIKEGDTLIRVPLNICLHVPTPEEWTHTNEGDEAVDYLLSLEIRPSPFISAVLRLMHHRAKVSIFLG